MMGETIMGSFSGGGTVSRKRSGPADFQSSKLFKLFSTLLMSVVKYMIVCRDILRLEEFERKECSVMAFIWFSVRLSTLMKTRVRRQLRDFMACNLLESVPEPSFFPFEIFVVSMRGLGIVCSERSDELVYWCRSMRCKAQDG